MKPQTDFAKLGIKAQVELDLPAMMAQKDKVVGELTKGVEFLLNKNKAEAIVGEARITAPGKVEVKGKDGATRSLTAKHIIIATGSDVAPLPGVTIDEKQIVSSTGALALNAVPKKLLVVGAGVIGLELGSVWRRLGSEVTVVEFLDRITPGIDLEVSKAFQRILTKQGMTFQLSTKVTGVEKKKAGLTVTVEPAAGGEKERDRSRCHAGLHRAASLHRQSGPGEGRRGAGQARPRHHRRALPHQCARASMPSAIAAKARCWRTRPRTKPWPAPNSSPARRAM